jgi:hypothetical protein
MQLKPDPFRPFAFGPLSVPLNNLMYLGTQAPSEFGRQVKQVVAKVIAVAPFRWPVGHVLQPGAQVEGMLGGDVLEQRAHRADNLRARIAQQASVQPRIAVHRLPPALPARTAVVILDDEPVLSQLTQVITGSAAGLVEVSRELGCGRWPGVTQRRQNLQSQWVRQGTQRTRIEALSRASCRLGGIFGHKPLLRRGIAESNLPKAYRCKEIFANKSLQEIEAFADACS